PRPAAQLGGDDPLRSAVVVDVPGGDEPAEREVRSRNGSAGGTSRLPSFPLTAAITVSVPGPVIRTVSWTLSPLKSPVAARTSPANPGNRAIGLPSDWTLVPNCRAAPSPAPETLSGRPTGGGGGGEGWTVRTNDSDAAAPS